MPRCFAAIPMLLALTVTLALVAPALAQDATPAGTPLGTPAGACDAPPLPPGTPTPIEEMAGPPADDAAATPGGEAPAEEEIPEPTPAPEGTPVDAATTARITAGYENFLRCSARGFDAATLFTDNLLLFFTGTTNPYDLLAAFAGEPPIDEIYDYGNVLAYPDGRFSIDETERTGRQVQGFRWYLVEEDGYLKLDAVDYGRPVDPTLIGETSTLVEVGLYDYAFGPETYAVANADLVTFRATNHGREPHMIAMVRYPEGTTAEQLIAGEVNAMAAIADDLGAWFALPGQTVDLALTGLAPGTYFLICDVQTATGTPHHDLGMVAEIAIE